MMPIEECPRYMKCHVEHCPLASIGSPRREKNTSRCKLRKDELAAILSKYPDKVHSRAQIVDPGAL